MKIALFHPGGTGIFIQQTAKAYYEAGILDKFFVTYVYRPKTFLGRLTRKLLGIVQKNVGSELQRRIITEVPDEVIVSRPWLEAARVFSSRFANQIATDRIWEQMEYDFSRFVAGKISTNINAVHGYEHGSLEVFRRAKQLGIKTIYEMPAPFYKTTTQILEAEYAKFPEMITDYRRHLDKLAPRRNKRREEELALSDIIICNSSFTTRSLVDAGVLEEKILEIPLGLPPAEKTDFGPPPQKIIFLYAGTISVGKGVHYLLEAWRKLNPPAHVELKMFGALNVSGDLLKNLPGSVTISRTVPRLALDEEYRAAHLLVFPTLCDGFGMVLTEALAKGCPVLVTSNAGSAGFIKNFENGFIVPVCDSEAILERMRWCIQNSDKLWAMRGNCIKTAKLWQWKDYRKSLVQKISATLS